MPFRASVSCISCIRSNKSATVSENQMPRLCAIALDEQIGLRVHVHMSRTCEIFTDLIFHWDFYPCCSKVETQLAPRKLQTTLSLPSIKPILLVMHYFSPPRLAENRMEGARVARMSRNARFFGYASLIAGKRSPRQMPSSSRPGSSPLSSCSDQSKINDGDNMPYQWIGTTHLSFHSQLHVLVILIAARRLQKAADFGSVGTDAERDEVLPTITIISIICRLYFAFRPK